MTRFTTVLLALLLSMTSAQAVDNAVFFDKTYGKWRVLGTNSPNTSCGAYNVSKIAKFSLVQFMDSEAQQQELIIEVMAKWWDVAKDSGTLVMTFSGKRGNVQKNAEYQRVDARTIMIRNIEQDKFLPEFRDYNQVDIDLDNGDDARLPLGGTGNVMSIVWDCIQQVDSTVANK